MTLIENRRTTVRHRALEAAAARDAEYAAEAARIAEERRQRLTADALDALDRIVGGWGDREVTGPPARRPGGWEVPVTVDHDLTFLYLSGDDGSRRVVLECRCPRCREPWESAPLADLADLGTAVRDADTECLACLGPEWGQGTVDDADAF